MPVDRKSPRPIEQAEQGILQIEPNARSVLQLEQKKIPHSMSAGLFNLN
jgi:hypothetical protein